ncbi:MAG: hypothetical protein LBB22_05275 [Treponema sp.]|jgi:hypothetical protein|nr:hypothetical protein [Treponema sp.]
MSPELISVLKEVISSWQVIAMTIAIVIYWSLVNAAVKSKKSIKVSPNSIKHKKIKRPPAEPKIDKDIDTGDIGIGD